MRLLILILITGWAFTGCNLEKIENTNPTPPLPTFETRFVLESNKGAIVRSVVEANDGGYIISGTQTQLGFTNECNVFVAKTSKTGVIEKKITEFGNFGINSGGKLIKASDGYYLTGGEYINNTQVLVIKLKNDLTVAWLKVYGNTAFSEFGQDLILTPSGDLLVLASGDKDPFFLKLSSANGMVLDSQTVNITNSGNFSPKSIARSGNNYVVMGHNYGLSILFPFLMKIDDNFNSIIPYKSFPDAGNGYGRLLPDASDGYVLIGGAATQGERQAYVSSFNGNGEKTARFDQFSNLPESGFYEGVRTPDGKYAACGWGAQVLGTDAHGIAVLLSASLGTETIYEYNSPGNLVALNAIATVSDGGFVLAGGTDYEEEIVLVKLNNEFKIN